MIPLRLLFAVALFSLPLPTLAQRVPFWGDKAPLAADTPPGALKQGQFTWTPQVAPAGPILVLVSLEEQIAYVYRNNLQIGAAAASTGKPGHETPTGVFHTILKDKDHRSSKYNNAAMPYTEKFTQDGVALHAGGLPGYPSSHGCVHLPSEFSRLLFSEAPLGMTVVISSRKSAVADARHPAFIAPVDPDGSASDLSRLQPGQEYRWAPEKSPTGPVSLVISSKDARAVVMRNGIEIGRARVAITEPEKPFGMHVFVAKEGFLPTRHTSAPDLPLHHWVTTGITGHLDESGQTPDPDSMHRIRIPPTFLREVYPLLRPGSTLVITDAPILENSTGANLTLFDTRPPGK